LAIQSDTGTGKTTFLIKWAKRNNRRLVIAVPTRDLCKQLAKKHSLLAVYGANRADRAADAAAAQIVVATYDTAHHLPDLAERALVIDEAHNLVNQYGQLRRKKKLFRARTLNRLQQIAKTTAQVVYLSGTMPKALLNAYNVPLVDVSRRNSPTVHLQVLKAHNSSTKAHTAALLSQLIKDIEANPNQTHFALVNNTKELKKIRALLIGSGRLQESDIEVLSRTTYDAGETSAFDDLVELSEIRPGVRLVLCTSIISEGVNIENTNIGNVYAVGIKCPDTVRQFAARFREMGDVCLNLILPPEREPGAGFSIPSVSLIEHMTTPATATAKLATTLSKAGHADNYDRSDTFPHIMPNEAGDGFTVDHLAILATDRDRMLETAPTSYTVGRLLSYHGFTLAAANLSPID
jgi:Rad3-related DNA helicase